MESRISCSRSAPIMSSGSISARMKLDGKMWTSPVLVSVYRIWNCLDESSRSMYRIFSVRAMCSAIWIARMDLPTLLAAKMTVFSYCTMRSWKKVFGSGLLSESTIQSVAGVTERRPTFLGALLAFSTSCWMRSSGVLFCSVCSMSLFDFDEVVWCAVYLFDVCVLAVGAAVYFGGLY